MGGVRSGRRDGIREEISEQNKRGKRERFLPDASICKKRKSRKEKRPPDHGETTEGVPPKRVSSPKLTGAEESLKFSETRSREEKEN